MNFKIFTLWKKLAKSWSMHHQIKTQSQAKNPDIAQRWLNVNILPGMLDIFLFAYKCLHIKQGEIIILPHTCQMGTWWYQMTEV